MLRQSSEPKFALFVRRPQTLRRENMKTSARKLTLFVVVALAGGIACQGAIGGLGGNDDNDAPRVDGDPADSGHVSRLSAVQWRNAARDALLADEDFVSGIAVPADTYAEFDTLTAQYSVGAAPWDGFRIAAEAIADKWVQDDGRINALAGTATSADERAKNIIRSVGRRAFRHTLSDTDVADLFGVYTAGAASATPDQDKNKRGLRQVIAAIFQTPDFFYRTEFGVADKGVVRLTGEELATKLAFALWNTGPNDAMLDAAKAGEFDNNAGYQKWVEKMLADPKANDTLVRFHSYMLNVDAVRGLERDTSRFPKTYAGAGNDMAEEMTRFVRYIAVDNQEGGNWQALLTSRTAFVNQKLANLYNVPASAAPELSDPSKWAKVQLPESERAGVATRAAVVARIAGPVNPSSIRRGLFVSERIACIPIPPPQKQIVVNFDTLEGKTNRQRVEGLTKGCGAGCHGNGRDTVGALGPLGFSLENYDSSGAYRTTDNGEPIDASSSLKPFEFKNAVELMGQLAQTDESHGCYTRQWATYLLGHKPDDTEFAGLSNIVAESKQGANVRRLVTTVVTSNAFVKRRNP